MINITEQIQLALPTPIDPRFANYYINGSNVIVETLEQYLIRVDEESRILGMKVTILSPNGTYALSTFLNLINNKLITYYTYIFKDGVSDDDFIVYTSEGVTIINDLTTGGASNVLSAEQGKVLKELIDSETLTGTNFLFIPGSGTNLENATTLLAAYNFAKLLTPNSNPISSTNKFTIIIGPGYYNFSSNLVLDTPYINIVSLTGNSDIIFNGTGTISITANNIFLRGFDITTKNFLIGTSLTGIILEDCIGEVVLV